MRPICHLGTKDSSITVLTGVLSLNGVFCRSAARGAARLEGHVQSGHGVSAMPRAFQAKLGTWLAPLVLLKLSRVSGAHHGALSPTNCSAERASREREGDAAKGGQR